MTDLNRDDEIIEVKLPRRDYEALRVMLERERAYKNITGLVKSLWIWTVGGGILTIIYLWDSIKALVK